MYTKSPWPCGEGVLKQLNSYWEGCRAIIPVNDFDDRDPPISSPKEALKDRDVFVNQLEVRIRCVRVLDFNDDNDACSWIDEKTVRLSIVNTPRESAKRVAKPRTSNEVGVLLTEVSEDFSLVTKPRRLRSLSPTGPNEGRNSEQNSRRCDITLRQPQEAAHPWLPFYKSYERFPVSRERVRESRSS